MKKYAHNENIFKTIETEDEAYWLGFILADGHNHKNKTLRVDIKDCGHLEKLSCLIYPQCNKPIKERDLGFGTIYYFDCSIGEVVRSLNNYGVVPNKSKIAMLPNIPDEMYRHFIRGLFDGDGSLSFMYDTKSKNYKRYNFTIVGKDKLMLGVKHIIERQCGIVLGYGKMKMIHRVYKKGNQQIMTLLNWMYSDSNVYLERKYNKYQEMLNYYKEK